VCVQVARLEAELKSKTHDFHGIISSLKTAEDLVRLKKDIAYVLLSVIVMRRSAKCLFQYLNDGTIAISTCTSVTRLLTNSAEVSTCEDSANQSNSSKVVDTSADVNNGTSESKRLKTPPTS
jgi:hypothetical protein